MKNEFFRPIFKYLCFYRMVNRGEINNLNESNLRISRISQIVTSQNKSGRIKLLNTQKLANASYDAN